MKELEHCLICPRECGVNRNAGKKGYCGMDATYHIASICIHKGEEPPINGLKGICNVFFTGCNLQCAFCQNFQISRRNIEFPIWSLDQVVDSISLILKQGIEAVGFVSPSHFIPHVVAIIEALHFRGIFPVIVYNTNCYDKASIIRKLEGLIDVYLPDFKYLNPELARHYSDASDYPKNAMEAIKEMYRQKGSTVVLNDNGQAVTGLIIRHLVLPGQSDDSVNILKWIASELSVSVHISLMSQYYPTINVSQHPVIGRKITSEEYNSVLRVWEDLGFHRGWIQDFESQAYFRPDFNLNKPFGD